MREDFQKQYQPVTLLFWQYSVLGAVLGIFALVYPFHAVFCFILLTLFIFLQYPDKRFLRILILCVVFAGAYLYAQWREPKQNAESEAYYQTNFNPSEKREFCGKIESVQGLPDGRLRIALSEVHKKTHRICLHNDKKLQGKLIYTCTYDFFAKRPSVGQYLQANAAIRPFHRSLRQYYQFQGAWYGAWNYDYENAVNVQGEGKYWSRQRENLRYGFVSVLFAEAMKKQNTKNNPEKIKTYLNSPQGQAKAILPALLFGDKFYLTQNTLDLFTAHNLSHSLALSGQHLTFAGILACFLIFSISCLYPRCSLHISRPQLSVSLGLVLGFLYCWLGDSPYSLLRAYTMLFFAGIIYVNAKQLTLLDLLFYALAFFIFIQPLSLYFLGVQLSFSCVFVIALLLPFLRFMYDTHFRHGNFYMRKFCFPLFSVFVVSFAVQVAIIPILLLYFGQISWSFFLNAAWLPLLTFWVMPAAFAGFLCSAFPFAQTLLDFACLPVSSFILCLEKLSVFLPDFLISAHGIRPLGLSFIGFYLLIFLLFFSWKKQNPKNDFFLRIAIFCLFMPVFLRFIPLKPYVQISLFEVGHGQAIHLRTNNADMLLDAGGTRSKRFNVGKDIVAKAITQNRFPKLDYIVASHDDYDHINGIAPLLNIFSVKKYAETSIGIEKRSYAKKFLDKELTMRNLPAVKLGRGDFLDLGNGYGLEVLYPPKKPGSWSLEKYTANNSSLVLRLVKDSQGIALFCGDSESPVLEKLAAMHNAKLHSLEADILILPHHGSESSYAEDFYASVNPRYVAVSCGKFDRFNFPSPKIVTYFQKKNIPVLSTADCGNISFLHEEERIFFNRKMVLQEFYSIL